MAKYQKYINVFEVRDNIKAYGVWYSIWFHGHSPYSLWTIFVAWRMTKYDRKLGLIRV
jgi:hypothetical protein